jgi:hypothetical protein
LPNEPPSCLQLAAAADFLQTEFRVLEIPGSQKLFGRPTFGKPNSRILLQQTFSAAAAATGT